MTELQRPGNGIPVFERAVLTGLLKVGSAFISDRRALKKFKFESSELFRIFNDDESYDAFDPYLIPRIVGIEDSSRNWSVAMVLDHLCRVNTEMKIAVESLSKGIVPHGEVDIALYKPDHDLDNDVLGRFARVNQDYIESVESLLRSRKRLPNHPRYAHPWFGEMNAHQWHCLAAAHQRIHRRQAQKIVAMLGIT